MPHSIHELWAVPLGFLVLLWTAFIVIGIKGLLFHREPRRNTYTKEEIVDDELIDPDSGEVIRPPGVGLGCGLCLLFIFWPLFLASKIDEWLPPPKA
jgi:hypothetical protein